MRRAGPNPVLVGAATLLVIVVAVVLAYGAHRGLPFAPTYRLEVRAPSAANLVVGNEVRLGGARVGTVDAIRAERRPDGSAMAVLGLELDPKIAPLPRDSTFVVRARSLLGLKYVELTRGRAPEAYEDGEAMPLAAARPAPVELDEVLNTFDARTRRAVQGNLRGFGDALAGRGEDLNLALGELAPLLGDLEPVMGVLSDPQTRLGRLVGELADAARVLAPVAENQASLFVGLDRTFAALRAERSALQAAITESRPALDAAIRSLPAQRPFLANAEGLFRELRPGTLALRDAAPDLAGALTAGTPALRDAPALNRRLGSLFEELRGFAGDPLVPRGLRRLTETLAALDPTLRHLTPAQTTCNYLTLWFRNVASHLSVGDASGTWQRFIIVAAPLGPNSEGFPSSAPANGPREDNYLHANPYPHTAAPGQPRECEAGNEPYARRRAVIGNVPGRQRARTEGRP